jgi:methionine-gamma-lyase
MQKFSPEEALLKARREFGEHGGVTPSVERSATFTVMEAKTMAEIFAGEKGKDSENGGYFLYSRHFNPTVEVLNRYLAAMEGTESAMCTASGMSAIVTTLMQLCKNGDHIVSSSTIYGGTHAFLEHIAPDFGISTTFVDAGSLTDFANAIKPNTKVLYAEVVSNPLLKVSPIPELAKLARKHNLILVVDNTFMPVVVSPAKLGADVVIYSMTKFINGASDVVAGVVCASREFIDKLMDLHKGRIMLFGPTMDPRVAFDIMQRLPHLPLRMREHGVRALAIATHLEKLGVKVIYPGLKSFSQHEIFGAMINDGYGYGGMIAINCGTREKAETFLDTLQNEEKFGLIAVSLGYFDTLMSCSGSSTSSEISAEDQEKMGLSPGLVRIAVGFTGSLETRIAQIEAAARRAGLLP